MSLPAGRAQRLFAEIMPGLSDGLFAVFNCFGGTSGNTRHAVRALISPNRLSVCCFDIIQRTALLTLPASGALIGYPESLCADHHGIHDGIEHFGPHGLAGLLLGKRLVIPNYKRHFLCAHCLCGHFSGGFLHYDRHHHSYFCHGAHQGNRHSSRAGRIQAQHLSGVQCRDLYHRLLRGPVGDWRVSAGAFPHQCHHHPGFGPVQSALLLGLVSVVITILVA